MLILLLGLAVMLVNVKLGLAIIIGGIIGLTINGFTIDGYDYRMYLNNLERIYKEERLMSDIQEHINVLVSEGKDLDEIKEIILDKYNSIKYYNFGPYNFLMEKEEYMDFYAIRDIILQGLENYIRERIDERENLI